MSEPRLDPQQLEAGAFEMVCYMATSACNLVNENRLYGPFRLIDAAARLITMLEARGVRSDRLDAIRARIEADQQTVMTDEAYFCNFLQELVLSLVPLME